MIFSLRILAVLTLAVLPAFGHGGDLTGLHDLPTAWEFDPAVVAGLLVSGYLYARGAKRERGMRAWERWCFWLGWLSLVVALLSPLHPLGEKLFSAHMVQHEILMTISAPLLVLGRPLAPFIWALPGKWRGPAGRFLLRGWPGKVGSFLALPAIAWTLSLAALWIWHLPVLFDLTLTSDTVHALQHISFLGAALIFWWALIRGHGRRNFAAGALYLFGAMLQTGLLGAFLTFSQRLWYPPYAGTTQAWGLTPLEDQQLGGLIMWVPACLIYVIAALALAGLLLRREPAPYEPLPAFEARPGE